MICRSCGAGLGSGNFCSLCGTSRESESEIASTRPVPPPPQNQIIYSTQVIHRPTNGFAIASLVLSLTCCGGILAIIFGHVALGQIKRSGAEGRGLAIAGLIIGYIGLAFTVLYILFWVVIGINTGSY